jgi:hypothetical protein
MTAKKKRPTQASPAPAKKKASAAKPAVATYRVGDGYRLYAWVTDDDLQRRK